MKTRSKKASMELSVNFLVVMILCLVLLGVGITLVVKGSESGKKLFDDINQMHQDRISKDLVNGKLFSIYPPSQTINRGDQSEFSFGIRNEEESVQSTIFCLSVTKDLTQQFLVEPEMLFDPGPYSIKSKELRFSKFMITMPKETQKGSYMFDVRVRISASGDCESAFDDSTVPSYGYNKVQLNII